MRIIRIAFLIAVPVVWVTCAGEEPAPSTQPAVTDDNKVLATVGESKILAGQINRTLANAPAGMSKQQLAAARQRLLDRLIEQKLIVTYLQSLPCSDEDLVAFKKELASQSEPAAIMKQQNLTIDQLLEKQGINEDMLRQQVKLSRIQKPITQDTVEAFIKAGPVAYFDGTTVTASHILVGLPFYASADEKEQARAKINNIAREIRDGDISFEDAAGKYSSCPSGDKGGDLGAFTFEKMVIPFTEKAFQMKIGEISDVVETRFGLHLIKVTARSNGDGKPGKMAKNIAAHVLVSQQNDELRHMALEKIPVSIAK